MSKTSLRAETLRQDMALIGHLREHLEAIANPDLLQLLGLAINLPITNSEVRSATGKRRNTTWYELSKLTRLGLLEKRGHKYTASSYALNLIEAEGLTLRAVIGGKLPKVGENGFAESNPAAPPELVALAETGVKVMYDRGMLTQDEYNGRLKLIQGFRDGKGVAAGR